MTGKERAWRWLLVSSLAMLAGTAMLATSAADTRRVAEFREARPCPELGRDEGCVAQQTAVLVGRRENRRKSNDFYFTFAMPEGERIEAELVGDDGVWRSVANGEVLVVRVFRGRITHVIAGDRVEETLDSPRLGRTSDALVGVTLLVWGGFGARFAFVIRAMAGGWNRRPGPALVPYSRGTGLLLGGMAGTGAALVTFYALDVTAPLPLLATALLAGAAIALLTALRRRPR